VLAPSFSDFASKKLVSTPFIPERKRNISSSRFFWAICKAVLPFLSLELISISEWYPVFRNKKSNIQDVVIWAKNNIVLENYNNLLKYIIYKKSNDPINQELISKSKLITDEIMNAIKFL
jgi:hypothetical protein